MIKLINEQERFYNAKQLKEKNSILEIPFLQETGW